VRVLVTGANGFIGARIVDALRSAGHQAVAAVRDSGATSAQASVRCDFALDVEPGIWQPRLAGIDAVVNCVGILRETPRDKFCSIHEAAPLALFRACASAGVRRVVQLSALGNPDDGEFIASKHRCDAALATLDLDWIVLRPGLVYSAAGAYGGTSMLRAIAALPAILVLPRDGSQPVRPIAAEDLACAVVAAVSPSAPSREIIELVGPRVLGLREYLLSWRAWFRLPAPIVVTAPRWLVVATVAAGEWSGRGPLCRVIDNLLERGRVGADDAPARTQALLGRPPLSLEDALRNRPSAPCDLLEARWYILRHMLTGILVLVWIGSATAGFLLPDATTAAIWPRWPAAAARAAALACSVADLVLGIALLTGRATRLVLSLMLAMVLGYTLIIGALAPEHWLDPFGGLIKNLPIAALLIVLLALEPRRR